MGAKVKICGLMRAEDAATSVQAGASYLGVVFARGLRTVTPDQAREIVAAAAGVPVFGVFAEQTVNEILQICARSELRAVQLHGPYSAGDAASLRAAGLTVWRVVRIAAPRDLDLLASATAEADAVLVEPGVPGVLGGSGMALDLAVALEARRRLVGRTMVLAGGLNPNTVGEAVFLVHPEVVDVSSGVEQRPGLKDPRKVKNFVEAVFAHSSIS